MFWRWLIFSLPVIMSMISWPELSGAWNPRTVRNLFQIVKEKRPNILFP
jgi:hypothetical protein